MSSKSSSAWMEAFAPLLPAVAVLLPAQYMQFITVLVEPGFASV